MEDIHAKFKQILTNTFGVPEDEYAPDATFESLGLDSLDLVELTLVIEEELGVKIEDDELEDIRTVNDAAAKVAAKKEVSA